MRSEGRLTRTIAALFSILLFPNSFLPAQQTPTIQVTSRLIYVDVIVRDPYGHALTGLEQSEFVIKEDGVPQKIELFTPHTLASNTPVAPLPAANPLHATNQPDSATPPALNLLLFDLADTPILDQPDARRRMIDFLTKLPPGHRLALFVLSDRLHVVQGFTGSSNLLASAARMIRPQDLHQTVSRAEQMTEDENIAHFEQGLISGGGRTLPDFLAQAIEVSTAERGKQQTKLSLDSIATTFGEIAHAVSGYPGRKNLFWLSGSFPVGLTEQLHVIRPGLGVPFVNGSSEVAAALSRSLVDSQIAIYPISVIGVETDTVGAEFSGLGTAVAPVSGNVRLNDTLDTSFHQRQYLHEVMNAIADATGGRPIFGTNDLTGALLDVLNEGANSYTLAYRPSNSRFDGQLRKIHVSVDRKGTSLYYRRSYFATRLRSTSDFTLPMLLKDAVQVESPVISTLNLSSDVTLPNPQSPHLHLSSVLDPRSIDFTTDAADHQHAQVMVLLSATRAYSAVPATIKSSGVLTLDFTPDQYKLVLSQGIRFGQDVDLESGAWALRLGVADSKSGRIGTLELPVQLP